MIPGYDKVACLFNPTKPVLACSVKHEVIFFTAANGFIPFSNWKQSELKLQAENTNKITALQWNVSFFNVAIFFPDLGKYSRQNFCVEL